MEPLNKLTDTLETDNFNWCNFTAIERLSSLIVLPWTTEFIRGCVLHLDRPLREALYTYIMHTWELCYSGKASYYHPNEWNGDMMCSMDTQTRMNILLCELSIGNTSIHQRLC